MPNKTTATALTLAATLALPAAAQSSSLYANAGNSDSVAAQRYGNPQSVSGPAESELSPAVPNYTIAYARRPEPRQFAAQDLITIVIRETFESELESKVSSGKKVDYSGGITDFPHFSLEDLLDLQLRPGNSPDVTLGVNYDSEFDGEGDYERTDSMIGRVTARIIDIKPNGTLVIEARKTLINDEEESVLIATGICRAEDITAENTILSTQIYDLVVDKQHSGQLKNSSRKGLFTRLLDFLFNF